MRNSDSSTPTVLIVDDEKNVRLTLRQALEDEGLRVETAENGTEALDQIEKNEYDLVLLDHRMPGLDGLEVLERARRIAPDLPIAIITAHGTVERAVKAVRMGAVDVLLKPISIESLRSLVGRVLRRPSMQEGSDPYDEWVRIATWHFQYRRTEAARHCLMEAIGRDERRPEAHTMLGILEANEDNLEAARQHFEAAVDRNPEDSTARLFLDRIREDQPFKLDRPLPLASVSSEPGADPSEEEQLDVSPSTEEGKDLPHRVLAVLGQRVAEGLTAADRKLAALAASSARAHGESELLLLTVIEVPWQLSLSQGEEAQQKTIQEAQNQLETLMEELTDGGLRVRPMVIVAHETSTVVENVVAQESVQHLLASWTVETEHSSDGEETGLSDSLDDIQCEVTLLRVSADPTSAKVSNLGADSGSGEGTDVAAFISESPYAPFVARRALEWAQGSGVASLSLLNVQAEDGSTSEADLEHRGKRLLWDVADRAGLEEEQYEGRVLIGSDIRETVAEHAAEYDLICVGASRSSSLAKSVFGSVTGHLAESVSRPIALVRGPQPVHRSFIEDLGQRLAS